MRATRGVTLGWVVAVCTLCSCRASAPRDALTDDAQGTDSSAPRQAVDAAANALDAGTGERLSRERASWPMPNSKNLALPHPARLEPAGPDAGDDALVHDRITDLVWSSATPDVVSFAAAAAHCAELAPTAAGAWRLPTRIELVSLLDRSYTPTIDPIFGETVADYFWTTSKVPGQLDVRFSVYFGVGETAWGPERDSRAFARCVHGGKRVRAPEYRVEEEEVSALYTELVWQRSTSAGTLTLDAARLYCSGRQLAESDARLPTPKELQTLLDSSQQSGYWLPAAFSTPQSAEFWADEGSALAPMRVDFATGFTGIADVGDRFLARCVR